MSHRDGAYPSQPTGRGMWLRSDFKAERFPTFAGSLPMIMDELSESDDETEEVTLTTTESAPQQSQPYQNRAPATGSPAPRRVTRRPRPSPLFGEGEMEIQQYTLRETLHMEERPNTLWETDLTDPGISSDHAPMWSPPEESVTLEVDANWRAHIRTIDEAWARQNLTGEDDLDGMDLELDLEDAHNRVKLQQEVPSPLALPTPDVEVVSLAMRAPAPLRTLAPVEQHAAPVQPVTLGLKVQHAAQAVSWFIAGATTTFGTGSALFLLLTAVLFAN